MRWVYSVEEHPKSDSEVRIYTAQKFSILLTDDLAAVVGENVYNTIRGDFFVFGPGRDDIPGGFCAPGRTGIFDTVGYRNGVPLITGLTRSVLTLASGRYSGSRTVRRSIM